MEYAYKEMWKTMMANTESAIKKCKPEVAKKILIEFYKINKSIEENYLIVANKYLTTKQVCDQYGLTRQNLHNSGIKPRILTPRNFEWSSFEVRVWRRNVEAKKRRLDKKRKLLEKLKIEEEKEANGPDKIYSENN